MNRFPADVLDGDRDTGDRDGRGSGPLRIIDSDNRETARNRDSKAGGGGDSGAGGVAGGRPGRVWPT